MTTTTATTSSSHRIALTILVTILSFVVTLQPTDAFTTPYPAVQQGAVSFGRQSSTQSTGTISNTFGSTSPLLMAKYNTMNEILAKFPADKPVLINFYDAKTENDIKADIFRAKELLADRATLVSIKQQDYPEIAKLWDANTKSPSMILFKDGQPVTRLYEETHYLEIVAKIGAFCK